MPAVADLRVFPIKALDGVAVDASEVLAGGTLAHDRTYRLIDEEGAVINGKQTPRVHEISANYDLQSGRVTLEAPHWSPVSYSLPEESEPAAAWFSDVFGYPVTIEQATNGGFVDRPEFGPSVVSTATLETVALWFEELSVEGARRRLRANVEIEEVPPFWEDRLVGADAPAFAAGDVRFEGVTPCGRCVVPTRDPDTGESLSDFRETFLERREATFPEWADPDAFEHYYSLMVITSIPEATRNEPLAVGEEVRLLTE